MSPIYIKGDEGKNDSYHTSNEDAVHRVHDSSPFSKMMATMKNTKTINTPSKNRTRLI